MRSRTGAGRPRRGCGPAGSDDRSPDLWGGHFWSGSYFAASVGGAPLTVLKQYIEQQKRPV
ncbi:transposase [Sphaerisporangium sp. NBC_01403]|uniref:transposase n=1 Tax=Sphaerisporangium sp. NBC_01403 TaxID=2903599 RepID=UPI00386BF631